MWAEVGLPVPPFPWLAGESAGALSWLCFLWAAVWGSAWGRGREEVVCRGCPEGGPRGVDRVAAMARGARLWPAWLAGVRPNFLFSECVQFSLQKQTTKEEAGAGVGLTPGPCPGLPGLLAAEGQCSGLCPAHWFRMDRLGGRSPGRRRQWGHSPGTPKLLGARAVSAAPGGRGAGCEWDSPLPRPASAPPPRGLAGCTRPVPGSAMGGCAEGTGAAGQASRDSSQGCRSTHSTWLREALAGLDPPWAPGSSWELCAHLAPSRGCSLLPGLGCGSSELRCGTRDWILSSLPEPQVPPRLQLHQGRCSAQGLLGPAGGCGCMVGPSVGYGVRLRAGQSHHLPQVWL